jgi:hypothetical protein
VNGGLYVSAGAAVYWAPVPDSNGNATAPFINILAAPTRSKIAGLAFNVAPGASSGVVYAALQTGSQGGSIVRYTFSQSTPVTAPTLTGQSVFVDSSSDPDFTDTPEFLVYQPDP